MTVLLKAAPPFNAPTEVSIPDGASPPGAARPGDGYLRYGADERHRATATEVRTGTAGGDLWRAPGDSLPVDEPGMRDHPSGWLRGGAGGGDGQSGLPDTFYTGLNR